MSIFLEFLSWCDIIKEVTVQKRGKIMSLLPCPQCGEKKEIGKSFPRIEKRLQQSKKAKCQKCNFTCDIKEWNECSSKVKMGDILRRGRLYKLKRFVRLFISSSDMNSEQNAFMEGSILLYVGYKTTRDKTLRKVKFIAPDGMLRYGLYNPEANHPARLRELFEEVEL